MKQKKRYMTAKQLGISIPERKALVAFAKAKHPRRGHAYIITLNGHEHYYDQGFVADNAIARGHECGTAGCIAGYVASHIALVQKVSRFERFKIKLKRLANSADRYFNFRTGSGWFSESGDDYHPLLGQLYNEARSMWTASEAQRVVDRMLRTGKVEWL